jgi:O-antigen/teichoic acid export membrane protein
MTGIPLPGAARREPATAYRPTLTQKASLTVVAYGLEYGAKIVVGLVVTPILVSRLGQALYGVFEMLGRLTSYVAPVSGRPPEALRLVVASRQAARDADAQRRAVGGALLVWLFFLPLAAAAGAVVTWLAPTLAGVAPALAGTVRLACAALVGAVLLGGLLAVPESVLFGVNLGYKRMELQAGLSVVGGVLTGAAAYAGLGLAGVSAAQLVVAAVTGLCYWGIARTYVTWFGAARPTRADLRALFAMSGWLSLGDVIAKLLLASDLVILGFMLSPSVVTTYVLTSYAARTAVNLHSAAVTAAMPGLGGLIGKRQFAWAALVRREIFALTWLFVTAAGATILLWNHSFVTLWIGGGQWAGSVVDLLIVLTAVQTAFIRTDSNIIDAALLPWRRVRVGAAAAVVSLVAMVAFTRWLGLPGLCLGIVTGRAVQTLAYPGLAHACFEGATPATSWSPARPFVAMALLFALATALGGRLVVSGWLVWAGGVMLSGVLATGLAFAAGLSPDARSGVIRRVRAIIVGRAGDGGTAA